MASQDLNETYTLSVEALQEWEGHMDDVLRGVAHALNNRAASVSAMLELTLEGDRSDSATRALLGAEVQRLHELVDVVRAVGAPRAAPEAFDARDAAATARAVMSLHAAMRDRTVTVDAPSVLAVRTPRWMFVRALVATAAHGAGGKPGTATIRLSEEDGWIVVRATTTGFGAGTAPVQRSRYADELARAMGGEPLPDAPGFRIPTLAEVRRREGR